MPVPTAELFDKQNEANGTNSTTNGHSNSSTEQQNSNESYFTSTGGAPAASGSSAQNGESGRALTREETDRLYEERMEEEYAKRDGGA